MTSNSWRGVTRMKPILTGHSYMRIGSIHGGKMVLYPIAKSSDGRQLVNWVVNIRSEKPEKNDWNKPGRIEDFLDHFKDWRFDWLDVPPGALVRPKDPREYARKLRFHQKIKSVRDYGVSTP